MEFRLRFSRSARSQPFGEPSCRRRSVSWRVAVVALVLGCLALVEGPVIAQDGPALVPLQFSQPGADQETEFGTEVALGDGLIAIAGDGTYLYTASGSGWTGEKLTDHSGPMAVEDGRLLIGDVGDGVYLFERQDGSWTESLVTQGVVGPVAFHRGNPVVVGQSGVLYMFEKTEAGEWSPNRLAAGFRSVAANDDRIVVGKFAATDQNTAGLVTIFDAADDGGFDISAIFPSNGSLDDGFGASIALDGDRLAVGTTSGKAYVFEHDDLRGWVQRSLPVPPSAFGESGTAFGLDVGISGNEVVVGSPNGDFAGMPGARPAAYVFAPNGLGNWVLQRTLDAPGSSQGFGYSVAIDSSLAVAGAPAAAAGHGRAFIFAPLPERPTPEVAHAVSCLAGNGRVDTNVVNPGVDAAQYRVLFQGLTDRSRLVEGLDWWRSPVTGRSDGAYQVVVTRDGVVVSDQTVLVSCDTAPPVVSETEVQVMSACRNGTGYVLFQMVNASPDEKPYVIEFAGVANRSTTAAGFGATVRATTGRPSGSYGVTVRSGTSIVDAFGVTIDC